MTSLLVLLNSSINKQGSLYDTLWECGRCLQERQNASAEANKSLWEKFKDAYNEFAGDPSKPNTSTNSNTTQVENALSPINSKGLSNFTGFIPFNLGLTIDGLSGIKINQKFTVDTDFLPTNYPSTVDFLIKSLVLRSVIKPVFKSNWGTEANDKGSISIPSYLYSFFFI